MTGKQGNNLPTRRDYQQNANGRCDIYAYIMFAGAEVFTLAILRFGTGIRSVIKPLTPLMADMFDEVMKILKKMNGCRYL